ncbi:MAG TPA: DUF58 domain-containing protein [Pirellulaceae bacterium]|nr:DUF58 domain-containing protein [Pirellulaceae bacterium]
MQLSKRRIRIRVTREGLIYVVVLAFITAGALMRNVNLLILLSGMMLVPLFLGWRLALVMLNGLELRRSFPSRLFAGQTSSITWRITNNRRAFPVWQIQIHDRLRRAPAGEPSSIQLIAPEIGPLHSEFVVFRAYWGERGEYVWGPTTISCRFPMGLIEAWCELETSEPFSVAPAIGKLVPNWDRRLLSMASGSHSRARRKGLIDDEFFALRPWRGGDPIRYIHWRSSARNQELMVKQFDTRSDRDMVLLLDLHEPRSARVSAALAAHPVEHVLSFAATIVTQLVGLVKGKVGLAICGAESAILTDYATAAFVEKALQELGIATSSDHPDLTGALINLAGEFAGGTPFYVVSTRPRVDLAALVPAIHWSRFRAIEPWLRWLSVDSPEFEELFTSPFRSTVPGHVEQELQSDALPIGPVSEGRHDTR